MPAILVHDHEEPGPVALTKRQLINALQSSRAPDDAAVLVATGEALLCLVTGINGNGSSQGFSFLVLDAERQP